MSVTLGEQHAAALGRDPGTSPPAVSVRHVSKHFRLPHKQYHTLKERTLHAFRPQSFDILEAVRDVTVDIAPGEFFGIVGRNGSGKSTLLKCLAGIYDVDDGEMAIRGRLSPFIELGVGFNPELTARDNVIINAIMLGLSRKEARARFDSILSFAELEEFVDLKLKNYSSGMYVRLAFATAVQVDAEILLIDEVLAVGDAAFQQKCFDEFTRLRKEGRTILFVTHDMGSVERFCNRAMLLERGRVVDIAEPAAIARQYNEMNFQRVQSDAEKAAGEGDGEASSGGRLVEISNAWYATPQGEILSTIKQGEPCEVRIAAGFFAELEDPIFAMALQNETGTTGFATSTEIQQIRTGRFERGSTVVIRIRFDYWLAPGRYSLMATVARAGLGAQIYDAHTSSSIIVIADRAGGGTTDLPHSFEIERG